MAINRKKIFEIIEKDDEQVEDHESSKLLRITFPHRNHKTIIY